MAMKLDRKYMSFYLEGRDASRLRVDIDDEEIAERVLKNGDLHATLLGAAEDAAKPLFHDRKRRQWLSDNEDAIKEAGGNGDEAYKHYVQGRVEELVSYLEPSVVGAMCGIVFGEDDDDEDDDDEDDDDEEDDEEGEGED